MRILLAVDTDRNIGHLTSRLTKILNLFDEDLFYIDILHIYKKPQADAPHLPNIMQEIWEDEEKVKISFLKNCQTKIEKLLTKQLHKSALVNSYLLKGIFFSEFKKHLKNHKYELIVLLPGKKDNLQLLLMGRNINKLIAKVDTPILILPKEKSFKHKSSCFIGMLENIKKDHSYFKKVKAIKKLKKESIKYLHIGKSPDKDLENLEIASYADKTKGFELYHGNRRQNHIYIMNHKPRKGMEKWLKSSFTRNLLSKNDTLLMII